METNESSDIVLQQSRNIEYSTYPFKVFAW